MLRQIIELENRTSTTSAAEWETDDYIEFEVKIVKRQNQLVDLGVVKMIVDLMKRVDKGKDFFVYIFVNKKTFHILIAN